MGGAVFSLSSLAWGQTMVGVMATSFKRAYASMHGSQDCIQCIQWPWARGRPWSTHASAGDSWTLTGKSGSVFCGVFSPGSWCAQGFVCVLQESISPVLWEFCNQIPLVFKVKFPGNSQYLCWSPRLGNLLWALELLQQYENLCNFFVIIVLQFMGRLFGGSAVGLMATSSKRTYATCHISQVCCSQSPCPCGRPLLTHAFAGDTQTLKGRSGSVSCGVPGSWYTQGFAWALWASLVAMGFDSKHDFAPPTILLGFLICPLMWGIFFWWDPKFSCRWVFSG